MNNELIAIQKECGRRQAELTHTHDAREREKAATDNKGWCNLHIPEARALTFRLYTQQLPGNLSEPRQS